MATNAPSSSSPSLSTGCVSTPITLLEIPSSISEELSVTTNITAAQKGIPSDYVFGSNISSRVVNADVTRGASSSLWTSTSKDQDSASSVFTTLAKAVTASQTNCKEAKNLEDSAKEVAEDKRRETLTLAEVDLVTGEEGELSIIRQHCRAYIFDANTQKWNNLGAVHFHLNDIPNDSVQGNSNSSSRSRIVVRLASTRKLVINTLIWSQMPVALVDSRTLRIGAINDEGHIKNYLFAFPPDESASRIYDMLISRKKSTTVACPQEICDKQSSTSNKDKLAGCKRQAETQITSDTNHLPLASPKIANTNILPPAANLVVFPRQTYLDLRYFSSL
ncbi:unnamed protein product [Heterobilharzia americana]|nr:unnamed protein product [Heterobilharzia americana]